MLSSILFLIGSVFSLLSMIISAKYFAMSLFIGGIVAVFPILLFTYVFLEKRKSTFIKLVSVLSQALVIGMCAVGILYNDPLMHSRPSHRIYNAHRNEVSIMKSLSNSKLVTYRDSSFPKPLHGAGRKQLQTEHEKNVDASIFESNELQTYFQHLPVSDHPEIANRSRTEVVSQYLQMFSELPIGSQFDANSKNPCWRDGDEGKFHCLPYAYILGMPKCGTTDLYMRLTNHPDVLKLRKKEIRYFTRGEFISPHASTTHDSHAGSNRQLLAHADRVIDGGEAGSIPRHAYKRGKHGHRHKSSREGGGLGDTELERVLHEKAKHQSNTHDSKGFARDHPHSARGRGATDSRFLDESSSIFDFTDEFDELAKMLDTSLRVQQGGVEEHSSAAIVDAEYILKNKIAIDGGPHTLWWPLQRPNGEYHDFHRDVSIPQLLQNIQPNAKFLITLSNPTNRMYSDYHFLADDLRPVKRPGGVPSDMPVKSPEHFHERVVSQIEGMKQCIHDNMHRRRVAANGYANSLDAEAHDHYSKTVPKADDRMGWFRASQICAHDRYKFGVGGWGRIAIGMYVTFIEKWLEHFYANQFLVLQLEDYDKDPRSYMSTIFKFLGLREPIEEEWSVILKQGGASEIFHFNTHSIEREEMWNETRQLLDDFYAPYNELLASYLDDDSFLWDNGVSGDGVEARLEAFIGPSGAKGVKTVVDTIKSYKMYPLPQIQLSNITGGTGSNFVNNLIVSGQEISKSLSSGEYLLKLKHFSDVASGASVADAEEHLKANQFLDSPGSVLDPNPDSRKVEKPLNIYRLDGEKIDSSPQRHAPKLRGANNANQGTEIKDNNLANFVQTRAKPRVIPAAKAVPHNAYDGSHPIFDSNVLVEQKNLKLEKQLDAFARSLCVNILLMNTSKLKYIFDAVGVENIELKHLVDKNDGQRSYFHCLAGTYLLAEPSTRSLIFGLLLGENEPHYEYFDPPLPLKQTSVLSVELLRSLDKQLIKVANEVKAIIPSKVDVNMKDTHGNIALHIACIGGSIPLVQWLLDQGSFVVSLNAAGRLPIHYAAAHGHTELCALLLKANTDGQDQLDVSDQNGVTVRQLLTAVGSAVLPADLEKYFPDDHTMRKGARKEIPYDRKEPQDKMVGGWSTERLAGYERQFDSCEVDQYYAHEITPDIVYSKYIATLTPVLIKGLIDEWPAKKVYERGKLLEMFGDREVSLSTIPYSKKFGGEVPLGSTLGEYIDSVHNNSMPGGDYPLYAFIGHRIASDVEGRQSLAKRSITPTPQYITDVFARTSTLPAGELKHKVLNNDGVPTSDLNMFINAQWAMGGKGTGAPVHFHNTAWAAVVYGAKKWFLYPPRYRVMSNKQIKKFVETDMVDTSARLDFTPLTCVQTAGDVMIVPESWGHGVLNIQSTVALATELKNNLFRVHPEMRMMRGMQSMSSHKKTRETKPAFESHREPE